MTFASQARDFLARQQKQARGIAAVYTRGATSIPLTVWTGDGVFRQTEKAPTAAFVVYAEMELLCAVADLAGLSNPATPARGDRVAFTIGASSLVFELAPQGDEPPWRFGDLQGRTIYRLHCKRVS